MRQAPDVIDPDFPSREEIEAVADLTTPLPIRDFERADWSDTSGDHRWRSLDPTYVPPAKPLAGWD